MSGLSPGVGLERDAVPELLPVNTRRRRLQRIRRKNSIRMQRAGYVLTYVRGYRRWYHLYKHLHEDLYENDQHWMARSFFRMLFIEWAPDT